MEGVKQPFLLDNKKSDNSYRLETIKDQLCPVGLHSDVLNSLCIGHGMWICANNKKRQANENYNINYIPIENFPKYLDYFEERYAKDDSIDNGLEVFEYVKTKSDQSAIKIYDQLIDNLNYTCVFLNIELAFFQSRISEFTNFHDENEFINKYIKHSQSNSHDDLHKYILTDAEYKYCLKENFQRYLANFADRQKYLFSYISVIHDLFKLDNLSDFLKKYTSKSSEYKEILPEMEIIINN